MSPVSPVGFDLLGPLPTGTTVLEASAGTGKTFTIAGLVTRLVAEGVTPLEQLLVVTFGRAATQELRERVRERLVSARDALADPVAAGRRTDDPLVAHLAAGDAGEVGVRQLRLVEACARFDAATVVTTHGFCEQVLRSLGTAGDVDDDVVLVEDLDDLTVEVVQDFYVRKWGVPNAPPPVMTLTEALTLARAAVGDPGAGLVPDQTDDDTARTRHAFAVNVRREVERRKRAGRVIGFDDLLTRLRATLAGPRSGPPARARLRHRFSTVLVDEFQDTDPVQWEILRTAFHGHSTLVLVGDPKQAIYAFRGADVFAYLDAAATADHHATLDHNWRSDPDLLSGLAGLFRHAALGDPRITVTDVAAGHSGRSLAVDGAPVRVRLLRSGAQTTVGPLRAAATADLVAEIVDLLTAGPVLTPRDGSPPRAVRPGDLAVIVRTGTQLDLVHAALQQAGVPAVRRTTSSVFRTPAARDWAVLLEALEQPHRAARLRRVALTSFVGWDAAVLDHDGVDVLGERLRWWIHVHAERGVAALFETVSRDRNLAGRLLGQLDGERLFTDLRHVGEALHTASMAEQLGLTAGLEWLRHRIIEAETDSAVERSRRLDSDAAAVQCVTIHASKGLEFPVVYVPFGWDRWVNDRVENIIPLFHDRNGARVRDVGGSRYPGFADSLTRHRTEEFGEDLRLTYVAMTRAQAQVTAWWAPARTTTPHAPLHRLLFGPDPAAGLPLKVPVPADTAAFTAASALAVDGALSITQVPARPDARWERPPADLTPLDRARLDRDIDTAWRRTSYSSLTAAVHDTRPPIGSEPEFVEKDDEPDTAAPTAASSNDLRTVASPWADLPGGTAFGTTVHAVLEDLDTAAPDLPVDIRTRVGAALRHHGAAPDADVLAAAVLTAVRTPLGVLLGGRALADVAPADRLTELEFELPLAGGDRPGRSSMLGELAAVWRAHVPAGDPLGGYANLLDDPVLAATDLRGYLTGSIDAVLRADGRYVVVDYKTNRLGVPDVPLTAWDYRPEAMADAMLQAHYPLQALLYEVALHRFLRWRLTGYAPDRDLGGVLYLFLRGMCGPGVVLADGAVPGVFAWRPPAALVVACSDLLAGASG